MVPSPVSKKRFVFLYLQAISAALFKTRCKRVPVFVIDFVFTPKRLSSLLNDETSQSHSLFIFNVLNKSGRFISSKITVCSHRLVLPFLIKTTCKVNFAVGTMPLSAQNFHFLTTWINVFRRYSRSSESSEKQTKLFTTYFLNFVE